MRPYTWRACEDFTVATGVRMTDWFGTELRWTRPGNLVGLFDGKYSSLHYIKVMDQALLQARRPESGLFDDASGLSR